MVHRVVAAGTAVIAALALQFSASAARLHYPLPSDSTAVNGTHQPMQRHALHELPTTALPSRGLHPHAERGLKRLYSGTPIDVLQYHYDSYPTGWNQSETDLTPTTVASASFGQIKTLNVDGNVLAQPLLVSNFEMPDHTTHNVLIVATGGNTVYAYDAQTYALLWKRNLGRPQSSDRVGCGDILPEYGISSTPIIVRTSGSSAKIYLVAASEPVNFSFHTKLHALDLGTGADTMKAREIAPSAKLKTGGKIHFDPQNQWGRSSLTYANGSIYMGIGSHCDNNAGNISGWVLRYDPVTLKLTGKFNTIEAAAGYELATVWMSGYAVAANPAGNIFAVTGNGNFNLGRGMKGYGESVLSLHSDLKKLDSIFTPANYEDLNNADADFGSGGVMVLPLQSGQTAPEMAVAAGKEGTVFVMNTASLGGLHAGDSGVIQKLSIGACWCGPAFYTGPTGPVVFYQGNGDNIRAFSVTTTGAGHLTQTGQSSNGGGFGGSFPIVSTNGSTAHTGVVWVARRGGTMQLEAYNAETLGARLFQANAGVWSNGGRGYLSPTVANGRVYVPAYKTVTVFGLTD